MDRIDVSLPEGVKWWRTRLKDHSTHGLSLRFRRVLDIHKTLKNPPDDLLFVQGFAVIKREGDDATDREVCRIWPDGRMVCIADGAACGTCLKHQPDYCQLEQTRPVLRPSRWKRVKPDDACEHYSEA